MGGQVPILSLRLAMFRKFLFLFLLFPSLASAACPAQFQTEEFVHKTIVNPMVTLLIPSASTCAAKTGLAFGTTNLVISVRDDTSATVTAYRANSSEIQAIGTLGHYLEPLAGKIRFGQVDAVKQPGVYEIQPSRGLLISNKRRLDICITGDDIPAATCMKLHIFNSSGSCH